MDRKQTGIEWDIVTTKKTKDAVCITWLKTTHFETGRPKREYVEEIRTNE